jgi:hypothetical protein
MISVDGKQLVFTHPRSENLILRRDAVFAHRCPRCKGIIHGLIIHRPGDPVPSPWRKPGGHMQEIHFRAFSEPAPGYMTAPEYVAAMIDVGEPCGQYFYDAYHFAQFGYRYHGRCKYSRAIFQFDTSPRQEALRLAGILKTLYGTDEPKWISFREKLATVPGLADVVIRKIGRHAGIAPDVIGKAQPVFLISKDDWDHKSFNTLVDEVLAFQPKDEKETVNV